MQPLSKAALIAKRAQEASGSCGGGPSTSAGAGVARGGSSSSSGGLGGGGGGATASSSLPAPRSAEDLRRVCASALRRGRRRTSSTSISSTSCHSDDSGGESPHRRRAARHQNHHQNHNQHHHQHHVVWGLRGVAEAAANVRRPTERTFAQAKRSWADGKPKVVSRLAEPVADAGVRLRLMSAAEKRDLVEAMFRRHGRRHRKRFVQLSEDLSALRWSWRDRILIDELIDVVPVPATGPPSQLGLFYGAFACPQLLVLSFGKDIRAAEAWLRGVKWLHATVGLGIDRALLEFLIAIFKQVEDAGGIAPPSKVGNLASYLNMNSVPPALAPQPNRRATPNSAASGLSSIASTAASASVATAAATAATVTDDAAAVGAVALSSSPQDLCT
eukprot:2478304-Pleurochrysis_carterae.AAC.1